MLQLLRAVQEVIRISLWYNSPFVGLLHEVFIALFLRKVYGVVFGFEVQMGSL